MPTRLAVPVLYLLRPSALVAAIIVALAGRAHADMVPAPTFVVDFLWLGVPTGPIVGLALLAATVIVYRYRRKRGKRRRSAALLGIVLFIVGNLLCYVAAVGGNRTRVYAPVPELRRADGTWLSANPAPSPDAEP
jgi:hypothetical protein